MNQIDEVLDETLRNFKDVKGLVCPYCGDPIPTDRPISIYLLPTETPGEYWALHVPCWNSYSKEKP